MSDKPVSDAAETHRAAKRKETREALAKIATECVTEGPMTFIADPMVPLLTAELQIRALLELGWTPPAYVPPAELKHHGVLSEGRLFPVCICGWFPPANGQGMDGMVQDITSHIRKHVYKKAEEVNR